MSAPRLLRPTGASQLSSICSSCRHSALRQTLQQQQHNYRLLQSQTTKNSITNHVPRRAFTTTRPNLYKSVQEAKARYKLGPFSWQAGLLFLLAGAGLTVYFRYEKDRMARARIAEQNKGMGKPLVGGDFKLTDVNGQEFTQDDLKGKYSLIYFGFTNCPDICPEELDKMAAVIDKVKKVHGNALRPIFISCDPARDTPEVVERYLKDFHEDIVGLTGDYEEVKKTCKAYRVYFSTPAVVKPGQDYLVDHSIYFFLMDPDVDFVEAIGRNFTVDGAASVITSHINDWKGKIDKTTPVQPEKKA